MVITANSSGSRPPVTAALGLQASWLVLGWGPAGWQQALANALYDLPILLSAVVAWRAATTYPAAGSTAEPNVRRGWLVVALGLSMPVVGNAIWSYHELVLGAEPFPSAADGFYLLFAPLCMVGFLWVARYPLGGARGVRLGLDALILVTAAGLFSWRFMFAPLIFGHEGNALALVFSLAYPALDLVLFSLLALIVLHPAGWNSAGVPLFAAGVGCFIVADLTFAFLVASGAYELGHPVDIFWTASVALIAFSAWADRRRAAPAKAARFAAWVGYLPRRRLELRPAALQLHPGPRRRRRHHLPRRAVGHGAGDRPGRPAADAGARRQP